MIDKLKELLEKATPGEWKVRVMPGGQREDGFIQAPRIDKSMGYDIEVLGEDTTGYPTREADMDLICAMKNALPKLLKVVEAAERMRHCLQNCHDTDAEGGLHCLPIRSEVDSEGGNAYWAAYEYDQAMKELEG